MNVFVSYSHVDRDFALKLSAILESDGFDVFIDNKIPIGNNIYRDIGKGIAKADVIIIIISNNTAKHGFVMNETASILSFFDRGRMPLVIPIVMGKDTPIPFELGRFNCIVIPYDNDSNSHTSEKNRKPLDRELEKSTIEKIRLLIAAHDEKIKTEEQEKKHTEEKVKTGLSKYIDGVFDNLKSSEKRNKRFAFWLYLVSIISLIATIVIAAIFVSSKQAYSAEIVNVILYGILCLFVIIILISLSKLLFTLAKSFMVESIRCSDRIHAISFGKFFLDAYGSEATRQEVIQAFSSWNIDNGSTSFRNQSSEDYDPKIDEIIKLLKQ